MKDEKVAFCIRCADQVVEDLLILSRPFKEALFSPDPPPPQFDDARKKLVV